MSVKLSFWGASGEVTGSCFLLESNKSRLLVDCGLFQGTGAEEKNRQKLGFGPASVGAVLLTHAHLDHCGRLPLLAHDGFSGPVWATRPSLDFLPIILYDSAKLSSRRETGRLPLYTETDVDAVVKNLKPVEYRTWYQIMPGFRARWWDAGHMLGSASIELATDDGFSFLFSGDLGNVPSPIVRLADQPPAVQTVVMETTYGDRLHPPRGEELKIIIKACQQIAASKGTLLIPAFSLERTQEFLHIFDHYKETGQIDNTLPVYLDSPMALKATAVFEKYPEYFNEHLKQRFQSDDPFDFPGLVLVEHGKQSEVVAQSSGPKVIISGSGMMSGGRVVNHAKKLLPDDRTIVLINGFQAEGTLGRELLRGLKEVNIEGLRVPVHAPIWEVTSMSGHADQIQLQEWFSRLDGVKRVFLVHGEEESRQAFAGRLKHFGAKITLPKIGDSFEFAA